jgi:hypothetical protein
VGKVEQMTRVSMLIMTVGLYLSLAFFTFITGSIWDIGQGFAELLDTAYTAMYIMLPFSILVIIVEACAVFLLQKRQKLSTPFYLVLSGLLAGLCSAYIYMLTIYHSVEYGFIYKWTAITVYPFAFIALMFTYKEAFQRISLSDISRHRATEISRFFIYVGLLAGIVCGCASALAALDHNPQQIYTDEPYLLLGIGFSWAGVLMLPISILCVVAYVMQGKGGKPSPSFYVILSGIIVGILVSFGLGLTDSDFSFGMVYTGAAFISYPFTVLALFLSFFECRKSRGRLGQ